MYVTLLRYFLYLLKKMKLRVRNHCLLSLSRTFIDFFRPKIIHGFDLLLLTLTDFMGACLLLTLLKI